jgi:hypothetical protein
MRRGFNSIQLAVPQATEWTREATAAYGRSMARRSVFDPLGPSKEPRWYVVRSMQGALLEARELPPGADLKRVFVAAMLEGIDAGWQLGEFSSTAGVFFCARDVEQRQVEITPTNPGRMVSESAQR